MQNQKIFFLLFLFTNVHLHSLRAWPAEEEHSSERVSTSSTIERNRGDSDAYTSRSSIISRGTELAIVSQQDSVQLPIEAGEYCEFLNAVVPSDRQTFYNGILAGKENIIYGRGLDFCKVAAENSLTISQTAALHYCNWRQNNSPSYDENPDSTEYGTYDLDGKNGVLSINTQASYFISGTLSANPDREPVSSVCVFFDNNLSTKKIPERSLSSMSNKKAFANQDFIKEFNTIKEDQAKWNVHFNKALVKKSKKAPEILKEAPKLKFSLEQKIHTFEEQAKSVSGSKRDQLEKLIKAYETLLETVKHTHNVVEARVILSNTSSLFSTNIDAQNKLHDVLQWAMLTPAQRIGEFEIKLQRKPAEKNMPFEKADRVWALAEETYELILRSNVEIENFLKFAVRARVNVDAFKSTMTESSKTLTTIVNKLSSIAGTAAALDSRLSLPLDGITALSNLIISASEALLNGGANAYNKHLADHEEHLDNTQTYAQEQFVSLSAYADALEKNILLEEKEKTFKEAALTKSTSPVPASSLWELWGKRVSQSKTNFASTFQSQHATIKKVTNQLTRAQEELAEITNEYTTLFSAMQKADANLDQATLSYVVNRSPERTESQLIIDGKTLMTATQDTAASTDRLRNIFQQKENKELEVKIFMKKLKAVSALAERKIAREKNFATADEQAWFFLWPERAPSNINENRLTVEAERVNPIDVRDSFLLAQKIATSRALFNSLQACYDRFEEVFSNHVNEEKSFAKQMKKQAELFAKTSEKIKTSVDTITQPKPTDQLYHLTQGAFSIADISNNLRTFLDLIVKEISPNNTNEETALENQIAFLTVDFSEKANQLQLSGWFNEIKWTQEVVVKLTTLITALREKQT